jgi:vitellogenic carboxypeptidase-like protein
LILTRYIKTGNATLARKLSEVNSKNYLGIKSHSGYITVKEEYNSNLFFWFFPHEKSADVPWIIWLQGGPGISSLYGLFDLIGPFKVEDGKGTYLFGDYNIDGYNVKGVKVQIF